MIPSISYPVLEKEKNTLAQNLVPTDFYLSHYRATILKSLMALSDETSNSKFQSTEERRVNILENFKTFFRHKRGPPCFFNINPIISATALMIVMIYLM